MKPKLTWRSYCKSIATELLENKETFIATLYAAYDEIPEELRRRETRIAKMRQAKEAIEAEARVKADRHTKATTSKKAELNKQAPTNTVAKTETTVVDDDAKVAGSTKATTETAPAATG